MHQDRPSRRAQRSASSVRALQCVPSPGLDARPFVGRDVSTTLEHGGKKGADRRHCPPGRRASDAGASCSVFIAWPDHDGQHIEGDWLLWVLRPRCLNGRIDSCVAELGSTGRRIEVMGVGFREVRIHTSTLHHSSRHRPLRSVMLSTTGNEFPIASVLGSLGCDVARTDGASS